MTAFDLGDDASTFNEMREKIDRRVAAAEAKLQLGTSSVDTQMQDIEREAMDIQLQDKLLEYKQQMGLLGAGSGPGGGKQIAAGTVPAEDPGVNDVVLDETNESNRSN
jgi:phage shock protein A